MEVNNIPDIVKEAQNIVKQGPPGPPPKPGLEWDHNSHRWIRPKHEEVKPKQEEGFISPPPTKMKVWQENVGPKVREARKLIRSGDLQGGEKLFNDAIESTKAYVSELPKGEERDLAVRSWNRLTEEYASRVSDARRLGRG